MKYYTILSTNKHHFLKIGTWNNFTKVLYTSPIKEIVPISLEVTVKYPISKSGKKFYVTNWFFYLSKNFIEQNIKTIYVVQIESEQIKQLLHSKSQMNFSQKEFFKLIMKDLKNTFNELFSSIPD